jgi:antitoxin ParD1/3/4
MKIRLRPELEELIKQDVQRGPYQSVDEFVERAVSLLHEQETWLADHGTELREKIEQGYAAAQRGELIDSDRVRSITQERKRAWLADQRDEWALPVHATSS